MVSNPTGILPRPEPRRRHDARVRDRSNVVAVFGPEHGFRGSAQAGGSEGDHVDPRPGSWSTTRTARTRTSWPTSTPVRRGDRGLRHPGRRVRGSTPTSGRCTRRCWPRSAPARGSSYWIGPTRSAATARGPMLKPGCTSGVGKEEILQQHGMTVGELARLFNAEYLPLDAGEPADELQVVQMTGWKRDQLYADTGLTWVMPSPNMPTPDTALVYPGTCLFEGDQHVRGPRHDAAVRADRRAVRRLPVGGGARGQGHPGRRLPGGLLHATFSASTRTCSAPASRCTSPTRERFEAITSGDAHDRRGEEAVPRIRLARRESARPVDRHAHRVGPVPHMLTPARRPTRSWPPGSPRPTPGPRAGRSTCSTRGTAVTAGTLAVVSS